MTVNEMYKCLKGKDGYLPIKSFITWDGKIIWGTEQGMPIADILKYLKGYKDAGHDDLDVSFEQHVPWHESTLYQYLEEHRPKDWWNPGEKT